MQHHLTGLLSRFPAGGSPLRPFLRDPSRYLNHLLDQVTQLVVSHGLTIASVIFIAGVLGTAARSAIRRWQHNHLARDARIVTILPPPVVDEAGGEALWSNLVGLLRPTWRRLLTGQPHVAFEYVWGRSGLQISLWVPGSIPPGLIERAVEAAWPGAQTQVAETAAPFSPDLEASGGVLRLDRPDHYPLRSHHDADPLRALLGAAAGLHDGECAAVQVLARPVTGRRLWRARRAAAQLRDGRSVTVTSRLFDLITPARTPPPSRQSTTRTYPERSAEVRAILDKASNPRWACSIRYAVATANPTDQSASAVRRRLRGRAHALASAFALYTEHNQLVRRRLRRPGDVLAARRLGRGQLLSVPELAALAHLPLDVAVPGLTRAGAQVVAPPPEVPRPGPNAKPLGDTDAGTSRPVALRVADARHHLHVLGATGTGKSTLLGNLVLTDVAAGRGALVIDPRGDLVLDLLSRLPERIASRTVLFDPEDVGPPPALNILDGPDPDVATDHLVGICRRIWADYWGPRTDDIMRAACLTLTARPNATLADIPRLLSEPAYRRNATAHVRDEILRGFWSWYEELSEAHRSFATAPLFNKLRAFLLRRFVRATVGARTSSFDMTDVLNGGLCLVRLPKGVLGEETTRLLGSFVLARAWQTATHRARADLPRKDAGLYIDECQNFLTLPHGLEDMLAEARAYRLSLTLAHQDLAQLNRNLRETISANARTKVFFSVSPEDARDLHRHVRPNLGEHDLAHLSAFQAAARPVVDTHETQAFTLRTRPLPAAVSGRARHIRTAARAAHGARPEGANRETPRLDDPRRRPPNSASQEGAS